MPVYEYRCQSCRRKSSIFVRSFSAEVNASCEHCQCSDMSRLFSRFAVHRSSGGGLDDVAGDFGGMEDADPRAMAQMMRQMSTETGEAIDPEMGEMLDRMEAGEMPDEMADDMGMGDDPGGGFDDDF